MPSSGKTNKPDLLQPTRNIEVPLRKSDRKAGSGSKCGQHMCEVAGLERAADLGDSKLAMFETSVTSTNSSNVALPKTASDCSKQARLCRNNGKSTVAKERADTAKAE